MRFVPRRKIYKAPVLSGCFTLLNLKAIKEVGAYDDKYFMYFEDWDLSRRVAKHYDTSVFLRKSRYFMGTILVRIKAFDCLRFF